MGYTKKTWIQRLGTNLNKFTKSSETTNTVILTNTPDAVTQVGTPFDVASMNNLEDGVNGLYPIDQTSRTLSMTADGWQQIPDGAATYLPNFGTTDSWSATNGTVAVSNSILRCTATADGMVLFRAISWGQRLMIFRIRTSKNLSIAVFGTDGSQPIGTTQTILAGVWTTVAFYNTNATSTNIRFAPNGTETAGDWIEVSQTGTYIGTGEYLTKMPSGQTILTNYGAIPQKGFYGQEFLFSGAQYIEADNPVFGTVGHIAVRFKANAIGSDMDLLRSAKTAGLEGVILRVQASGVLRGQVGNTSTTQEFNGSGSVGTVYRTVVFNISGTTLELWLDAVINATGAQTAQVGGVPNNLRLGLNALSSNPFSGIISHVHIGSDVWDANAVKRWHENPTGNIPMEVTADVDRRGVQYDLIIDSSAKFAQWQASGTWEKVYIKKGTWTLASGGIDLTARGTKVIEGESGSLLVFSNIGTVSALYYTANQTDNFMKNITARVDSFTSGTVHVFQLCNNMQKCKALSSANIYSGYNGCINLVQCESTLTPSLTSGSSMGYASCSDMTGCIASVTTLGSRIAYGVSGGSRINNCYSTTISASGASVPYSIASYISTCFADAQSSAGTAQCFSQCRQITSCYAIASGLSGFGYSSCERVTSSYATAFSTTGTSSGYYTCDGIVNCYGQSATTSGTRYDYNTCKKCQQNTAFGSTNKYNASYADAGTSYACADTPNGGFNS